MIASLQELRSGNSPRKLRAAALFAFKAIPASSLPLMETSRWEAVYSIPSALGIKHIQAELLCAEAREVPGSPPPPRHLRHCQEP